MGRTYNRAIVRQLRLRPHKDAPCVDGAARAACGEGFTRQGAAIAAGKGIFPVALAQRDGNWAGALRFSRARLSRAQRAARATCGAWCNRVAAAIRFLGAWGRVGKKKERERVPLNVLCSLWLLK